MVCSECGHWAWRYDWIERRLGENNPRRSHCEADPDDPSIYWFIVCRPNCQLNEVRHASFRLEEEAAATMCWDFDSAKRAVEELREAWTTYYVYYT